MYIHPCEKFATHLICKIHPLPPNEVLCSNIHCGLQCFPSRIPLSPFHYNPPEKNLKPIYIRMKNYSYSFLTNPVWNACLPDTEFIGLTAGSSCKRGFWNHRSWKTFTHGNLHGKTFCGILYLSVLSAKRIEVFTTKKPFCRKREVAKSNQSINIKSILTKRTNLWRWSNRKESKSDTKRSRK